MTPDTTTALLILHEREKQVKPRGRYRRALITALEICCELSAKVDQTDKPKTSRILGLTKSDIASTPFRIRTVRMKLRSTKWKVKIPNPKRDLIIRCK